MPISAIQGSIASRRQRGIPWVAEIEVVVRHKSLEALKEVCTLQGLRRTGSKKEIAQRILYRVEQYHRSQNQVAFDRLKADLTPQILSRTPISAAPRPGQPPQQPQAPRRPGNYVDAGTQTEELPAKEKWWIRERKGPQKRILSLTQFLLKRTNTAREERQARRTADAVAEEVLGEIMEQVMAE